MKKMMRLFAGVLTVFTLLVSIMPATVVKAENTEKKTYTVTFRAGNVGSFNLNAGNISGENIEATANYIKFTVEKGESLSSTFDFISDDASLDAYFLNVTSASDETAYIDSGYRLKAVSDWCAGAADAAVNRNTEYVLDYAKLVDPVKYMIRFVDAESGEQIAPPTIAYGNAGEEIVCNPLTVTSYSTADTAVNIVLNAEDENANTITFKYTYTGETGTVVQTVTEYVPGETVTQTVTNEIQQEVPAGPAVVVPDAGNADAGNVDIDDENVPLDDGEDEDVTIEDEEIPLADGEGEDSTTNIEDEETPLAAGNENPMQTYLAPILGGMIAIVVVFAIAAVVLMKRKQSLAVNNAADKKDEK